MKKIFFIFILCIPFMVEAQLSSLIVRNDTLFNFDPLAGTYTQLTKWVPPVTGQSGKVISTNGTTYTWVTPFDGAYASLSGRPTLFDGTWASLTGKPTISGTNTGDDAVNATYSADYRAANFVAGTNYLAPGGNGSQLTGLTAAQVSLGNVTNESKATMFSSPTFTGTVTLPASTSLTTPVIGVATGTSLTATGFVGSSGTAGIGYSTGAGGTVSQLTNKSTGVTLNKTCGTITMNGAALAAAAEVAFTLTNSTIAANDVVVVSIKSGATANAYFVTVGATGAGSCSITLGNTSTGSLSEAVVLNFAVIKAVAN